MSDIFKSAFGMFNNNSTSSSGNDFVGQLIEIGSVKLNVKRLLAEGGFAYVYVVQDPNTSKEYALKRLLSSDKESNQSILNEIKILKLLTGHVNIIQYIATSSINKDNCNNEYLVLTELCTGGSLVDYLAPGQGLPQNIVASVFYQTCRAVQHMHSQVLPVIHRDLKIENLLLSSDGNIKLCDFGSATCIVHRPDMSWNAGQRALLEDEMARHTTPMYRAPEMVDTWNNYPIGTPCDIWSLGCILYMLCFGTHPFSDSAKLRILNANYNIPAGDAKHAPFHDIIRGCLKVNPEQRLNVNDILERLAAIAESMNFNLRQQLKLEKKKLSPQNAETNSASPLLSQNNHNNEHQQQQRQQEHQQPPPRPGRPSRPEHPPPPQQQQQHHHQPAPGATTVTSRQDAGLFSSIKGGAGSFFKNLKDTSSKVMQTVHQSIARSDLDVSYLTSRLLVMPYPADGLESAYKSNHVDDVRAFLETRHTGGRYTVYNLTNRSYHPMKLGPGRVVDCPFVTSYRRVPPLHVIFSLCNNIMCFLERDARNVAVVHCSDGKASSGVLVCCLLMYCGMMELYEDALQMFAVKRTPPELQPSETRYLNYMSNMLRPAPVLPHHQLLTIVTITLQPVPLFTKVRDGCRPYVDVYQYEERVKTTLTDYDRLRVFNIAEGKVSIPLHVTVSGDITICVYHARQSLGGVMSSRPTGHKICQIQFHTGFISEDDTSLIYTKCELDELAEEDHYQGRFQAIVSVLMCENSVEGRTMPWETPRKTNPELIFANKLELDENYDNFVTKPQTPPKNVKSVAPPPRPDRPSAPVPVTQPTRVEPPEEQVLLNFGVSTSEGAQSETGRSNNSRSNRSSDQADLLGLGLDEPSSQTSVSVGLGNMDDMFESVQHQQAGNGNDLMFDLFNSKPATINSFQNGSQNSFSSTNWTNFQQATTTTSGAGAPQPPTQHTNIPRNSSTPNFDQKTRDPFAEFGNLGASLNIPTSTSKPTTPLNGTPVGGSPNVQSPIHRPGSQVFGGGVPGLNYYSTQSAGRTPIVSPTHQMKSPSSTAADYSRSHFDSVAGKKSSAGTGAAAAATTATSGDVFGDLLGSQGYEFAAKKDTGVRTMNQLRKEDMVREMDPDRVKIIEWTEGKKGNIRALLCSINTVLWSDCKWKGVEISHLVSPADVKKAYRRACLAVHPDKQVGTENENIAKLIFVELNNAWSDFENDSSQQNLFAASS